VRLGLLLAAAGLLAACSAGGGSQPAAAARAAPAAAGKPVPPASPTLVPAVPESITLTGALNATIDQASVGQPCGRLAPGYYMQARFSVGGTPYALELVLTDYAGPGPYAAPAARLSVHTLGLSDHPVLYAGIQGSVTIATGERSGTLDSDLASQSEAAHVSGSWRCP